MDQCLPGSSVTESNDANDANDESFLLLVLPLRNSHQRACDVLD